MQKMDIGAYLSRIGYRGSLEPTLATLRALHRAHLLSVPFENLDIHHKRPIVLDEGRLFDKIVSRQRGGFCYELNGLFAALLGALGFEVARLAARVWNGDGFGMAFDHLALMVQLEERWLADVGFGDSFMEPLRLDEPGQQIQEEGRYRILIEGQQRTYLRREEASWKPQYIFTLQPYRLADFTGACHYHQTSPESSFTQRLVCSRATTTGRITVSDRRLIITANGSRQEHKLEGEREVQSTLRELFGITM